MRAIVGMKHCAMAIVFLGNILNMQVLLVYAGLLVYKLTLKETRHCNMICTSVFDVIF